jgi:predicted dehydrogenase
MGDIKAALVGAGFIGPVHAEALARLGVEVKGILDITPEKSRSAAKALGLKTAYNSYDEVLKDGEVSCVHIASPNKLHFGHVKAALDAGKNVVCEKPLAMTSGETLDLVRESAKRLRQVAAVNYNIRFYPLNLEAKARIAAGELGEIFHVRGSYVQDWLMYPDDFNWRVLAEEGGATRAIGDIGTHWLDLVLFLTGLKVDSVMADLKIVHPVRRRPTGDVETFKDKEKSQAETGRMPVDITTEDYGSVLLKFRSGARGVLTVSQVTAGRKNRLEYEIAGSKGSLHWVSEAPNTMWFGSREKANSVLMRDPALLGKEAAPYANFPGGHNEGFPDTFKQAFRAIYADIRAGGPGKAPLYATFEDGHRELLLCEAILESNRKSSWVTVKS